MIFPDREDVDALLEGLSADGVDDEMNGVLPDRGFDRFDEGAGLVVDEVRRAEVPQAGELVVARGGGEHLGAGGAGDLDGREPDAARARVHEHALTFLELAQREERLVGGAERHRDARHLGEIGAGGHEPRRRRLRGDALGVRTVRHERDDPVADLAVLHLGADLAHRAGALVADDVGHVRERRVAAVQGVATLDADDLDVDHHAVGRAFRVGHLLVLQDFGTAVS